MFEGMPDWSPFHQAVGTRLPKPVPSADLSPRKTGPPTFPEQFPLAVSQREPGPGESSEALASKFWSFLLRVDLGFRGASEVGPNRMETGIALQSAPWPVPAPVTPSASAVCKDVPA